MRKFTSYVPLHGHSSYSVSDGVSKIDDIFKRAKELGFSAISLTEHGNISSFYKFYNAAKGTGIKPIIGCEFYLNDAYHSDPEAFKASRRKSKIIIPDGDESDTDTEIITGYQNNHMLSYAKNFEGVNNIIHLANQGYANFYGKPLISSQMIFDNLDKNNIVTTACLSSNFNKLVVQRNFKEATRLLSEYKEKFGDDFYIEMHINELDDQTLVNRYYERIAPKLGIKMSIALDYHYVNKEDWEIQYLLYAIKSRKTVKEMPVEDWFYQLHDLYIKSTTELYDKAEKLGYSDDIINHAIETTFEIADKVQIEIPTYQNKFPEFTTSQAESEMIFDDKISSKWQEKLDNGLIPVDQLEAYQHRLSYEISIIKDKKFVDYFLILDDLLNNFVYKSGGASGAGRGSAGGSLVLFVLDITKIDPIKHGLIFERFLNPARRDPADVDCLCGSSLIVTSKGFKHIEELTQSDFVFDIENKLQRIINIVSREVNKKDIILEIILKNNNEYGSLILNDKHKLILEDNTEILCNKLKIGDKLKSFITNKNNFSEIIAINVLKYETVKYLKLVDIQVENSSTFQIIPFSVNSQLKTSFIS